MIARIVVYGTIATLALGTTYLIGYNKGFDKGEITGYYDAILSGKLIFECRRPK